MPSNVTPQDHKDAAAEIFFVLQSSPYEKELLKLRQRIIDKWEVRHKDSLKDIVPYVLEMFANTSSSDEGVLEWAVRKMKENPALTPSFLPYVELLFHVDNFRTSDYLSMVLFAPDGEEGILNIVDILNQVSFEDLSKKQKNIVQEKLLSIAQGASVQTLKKALSRGQYLDSGAQAFVVGCFSSDEAKKKSLEFLLYEFAYLDEKDLRASLQKVSTEVSSENLSKGPKLRVYCRSDVAEFEKRYKILQEYPDIFQKTELEFFSFDDFTSSSVKFLEKTLAPQHKKDFIKYVMLQADLTVANESPVSALTRTNRMFSSLAGTTLQPPSTILFSIDCASIAEALEEHPSWMKKASSPKGREAMDKMARTAPPSVTSFFTALTGYCPQGFKPVGFKIKGAKIKNTDQHFKNILQQLYTMSQKYTMENKFERKGKASPKLPKKM